MFQVNVVGVCKGPQELQTCMNNNGVNKIQNIVNIYMKYRK